MNAENLNATEARSKIFCSVVMKEGTIKRGILIDRMHVSDQTFGRELMTLLEQYPNIHYDRKTREFSYHP